MVDPHLTTEAEVKYSPLMASVKAPPPAMTRLGLRPLIAGGAGLMVKLNGADVPAAVVTVTLAVPEFTIRFAGTAAVSCVGLT